MKTMSQVDKHACMQLSIWRMYIIELISEMVYEVYNRVGNGLLDLRMSQVNSCLNDERKEKYGDINN